MQQRLQIPAASVRLSQRRIRCVATENILCYRRVWEKGCIYKKAYAGRRKSRDNTTVNFDRLTEVTQKIKELTAALDAGTYIAPHKMTVGQWLDTYGHVTEKMKKDSADRMQAFIKSVS